MFSEPPDAAVSTPASESSAGAGATAQSPETPPNADSLPSSPNYPSSEPSSGVTGTNASAEAEEGTDIDGRKAVTTQERQPLVVPSTVHVRITPETLKDYVGPQVYQRDRIYAGTTPPPPGVSTGLGYLGNGSGAVMPVEAMVCLRV